jgi:hypothetical protein
MQRQLFDISGILEAAGEYADGVWVALATLADDLNSDLDRDYEVTLVHLDTVDYLAFARLRPGMNCNAIDQEETPAGEAV